MAVKLRLSRVGRRNASYFRVVVADSRAPRDGRCIEILGQYQPQTSGEQVKINESRALYWLSQGAIPTETVRALLSRTGVLKKFHDVKQQKRISTSPSPETVEPKPNEE